MSRKSLRTEEIVAILNKEEALEHHYMSSEDMKDFVSYVQEAKKRDSDIIISLVDYLTEEFYSNKPDIR